jgi:two-component system, NtrC family, nitrogen regulation response regulator NtrX
LFLDEIGDMPPVMQAKLLRVLEEGEIERVGGSGSIRVDVRVVVATHRNLEQQVRDGRFREDLYHRIFVFPLMLPPLRDRKGDVEVLVEHFGRRVCEMNGWKLKPFSPRAVEALNRYSWPGNVRELRNMIERLLLLADVEVDEESVRATLPASAETRTTSSGTLSAQVDGFERQSIRVAIERANNNLTEAARSLGLERSHLYKKCAQLGIDLKELRRSEN